MAKYTKKILVPVTPTMADDVQREALREERTVAGYVRRVLARALAKRRHDQ